jgi:hypothetical protein
MSATVEVSCAWCAEKFTARTADRKRGWGKFRTKSCKASKQKFGGTKAFWEKASPGNKRSNIAKYGDRLTRWNPDHDDHDEIMSSLSDMDYGASDGGGYEPIR